MKPHKHKDLIIAWANGAQIQVHTWRETFTGRELFWNDVPNNQPDWCPLREYRIKPREFEEGAFYPVLDVMGDKEVAWYSYGNFYLTGDTRSCSLEDLTWVGEPLNIDWPEAE